MMTRAQFEQALDRWGSDLGQWPAAEAQAARALLAAQPDAGRALEAAHRVDGYFAQLRDHAPPSYLARHIGARAAEAAAAPAALERLLGWFGARLWRPAVIALLVTGVGFIAGATVGSPGIDSELAEDVTTLAFNDIYAEIEDAEP